MSDLKRQLADSQGSSSSPRNVSSGGTMDAVNQEETPFSSSLLDMGLAVGGTSIEPTDSNRLSSLEDQLAKAQHQLASQQEENCKLKGDLSALQEAHAALQKQATASGSAGEEVMTLRKQLADADKDHHESVAKLKKELQQKSLALEDAYEQTRQLQDELNAAGGSREAARAESKTDEVDEFFDGN